MFNGWLIDDESIRMIEEMAAELEHKRIQRLREAMLGEYPESEPARSFDELIVAGDVDRARGMGVEL